MSKITPKLLQRATGEKKKLKKICCHHLNNPVFSTRGMCAITGNLVGSLIPMTSFSLVSYRVSSKPVDQCYDYSSCGLRC